MSVTETDRLSRRSHGWRSAEPWFDDTLLTAPLMISKSTKMMDDLDVRSFLASPRHAYFFRVNEAARMKIQQRLLELRSTGMISGKTPIINIQEQPDIVEMHDGNASAVAWLPHAGERRIAPELGEFKRSFDNEILLRNRMHTNGDT